MVDEGARAPTLATAGVGIRREMVPPGGHELSRARLGVTAAPTVQELTVAIVDPHPYSAYGLRLLLSEKCSELRVVAVAATLDAAAIDVATNGVDLVVVAGWPTGAALQYQIKALGDLCGITKVVVLSDDRAGVRDAMRAGVQAYLSKGIQVDELVSALRLVKAGEVVLSPWVVASLLEEPAAELPGLTSQDKELLRLIVDGQDNAQIARNLAVSESTLKRNLNQLLRKLHVTNRTQAAVYAARQGLL